MRSQLNPLHLLRRPAVLDTGLALPLGALSLLGSWQLLFADQDVAQKMGTIFGSAQVLHWHAIAWLAVIVAELAVLPLRRRFPVPVLLITIAMATAHTALLPLTLVPADIAVAAAVYSVAGSLPRLRSAGLVIVTAGSALVVATLPWPVASGANYAEFWPLKPASAIVPVLALAAAWIAGDSARTRRAYLAEAQRRAQDLERDRDQRAELAAAAERERITRELHDIVAHALSVMVIQAQGGASALRRRRVGQADKALDAIVVTGRSALAETRRVLGVIRLPGDPELLPQPCLDDLPDLASRVRQAGTPVRLAVTGEVRRLPPGIELSAHRIVQEALTNTMRHSGPGATADVRVVYSSSDLLLEITDDGHPGPSHGPGAQQAETDQPGHGLAGMRARVAMMGGELSAGLMPEGGFRVRARLPLAAPADAVASPAVPAPADVAASPAGPAPAAVAPLAKGKAT